MAVVRNSGGRRVLTVEDDRRLAGLSVRGLPAKNFVVDHAPRRVWTCRSTCAGPRHHRNSRRVSSNLGHTVRTVALWGDRRYEKSDRLVARRGDCAGKTYVARGGPAFGCRLCRVVRLTRFDGQGR
ncbi:hypothetical protein EKG83_24145 [Saccharothrix syringae]|uniref:Uncharacterized protein n=1 Tax=Saccharothrix syringae TaxID=103733 RepID=A0A5Q0H1F2_SACSY|nr:hypothetical protein EKG83_24145 [Saccharothrix syringae]